MASDDVMYARLAMLFRKRLTSKNPSKIEHAHTTSYFNTRTGKTLFQLALAIEQSSFTVRK